MATAKPMRPDSSAFPSRPIAHLLGSNGPVHALAYSASPGSAYVLTGSADRCIRLYNPATTADVGGGFSATSSGFITRGGGGGGGGGGAETAVPRGRLIQAYASHGYPVLCLAVSRDNRLFASGSAGDRAVFLWDVAASASSSSSSSSSTTTSFSGGGVSDLVNTTTTSTAPADTAPIRRFGSSSGGGGHHGPGPDAHQGRVNAVCFAGEADSLLVSGGDDRTVRVWDVRAAVGGGGGGGGGTYGHGGGGGAGRPIQVLAEARDAVTAVAATGWEIVAASVDGRVRSYDVRMGRCVVDVVSPAALVAPGGAGGGGAQAAAAADASSASSSPAVSSGVTALDLARSGASYLAASLDGKIRLMDRRTGGCLKTYGDGGGSSQQRGKHQAAGGTMSAGRGGDAAGEDGDRRTNASLRIQAVLGGRERWVVSGDEMAASSSSGGGGDVRMDLPGRVWAWDLLSGEVVARLEVPWGPADEEGGGGGGARRRRAVGRDGREKERRNVVSCLAWQDGGWGDQFCVGGTSGVVTVYGPP